MTIPHELGHNFGLGHANRRDCLTCDSVEYGDHTSAMGSIDGKGGFYSAHQLAQLGWLDAGDAGALTVSASSTPALAPLECETCTSPRAVKIRDGDRTIWLEYRQPAGVDLSLADDPTMVSGLLVRTERPAGLAADDLHGQPFAWSVPVDDTGFAYFDFPDSNWRIRPTGRVGCTVTTNTCYPDPLQPLSNAVLFVELTELDSSPPSATLEAPLADGDNGWTTTSGRQTWKIEASDPAGVRQPNCTISVDDRPPVAVQAHLSTMAGEFAVVTDEEGVHRLDCVVYDKWYNPTHLSATAKFDYTRPYLTEPTISPAPVNGWNQGDVTVTWGCGDATSGIVAIVPIVRLSREGAGQVADAVCTDKAGNEVRDSATINIDLTDPEIATTIAGSPDPTTGWYRVRPTFTFSCTDAVSQVDTVTPPVTAGEGADQTVTGACTDKAGRTATSVTTGIDVDTLGPRITFDSRTAPNGHGWNNEPVTAVWSCADATSGAVSPTVSGTLPGEGENQHMFGRCADRAGNASFHEVTNIDIDLTPPQVVEESRTPATGDGWNNGPVTVTFRCVDLLSKPVVDTVQRTVLGEGTDQTTPAALCTDKADNTGIGQATGINIDMTAPVPLLITPAGATYKVGQSVPADYACTDDRSGVKSCTGTVADGASVDTSSVGERSFVVQAADKAGNTSSTTHNYTVVKADTTTTLSSSVNPSVSGQTVTYTAAVAVNPPGSGTPTGTVAFTDNNSAISGCGAAALNAAGKATCTVSYPGPASHPIKAAYAGSSQFNGSQAALTQTVNKAATKLVADRATRSLTRITFSATLTRVHDAAPLQDKTVTFKVSNATVCTANTNSTGRATCTVTGLVIGSGTYTATFAGDSAHLATSATGQL